MLPSKESSRSRTTTTSEIICGETPALDGCGKQVCSTLVASTACRLPRFLCQNHRPQWTARECTAASLSAEEIHPPSLTCSIHSSSTGRTISFVPIASFHNLLSPVCLADSRKNRTQGLPCNAVIVITPSVHPVQLAVEVLDSYFAGSKKSSASSDFQSVVSRSYCKMM